MQDPSLTYPRNVCLRPYHIKYTDNVLLLFQCGIVICGTSVGQMHNLKIYTEFISSLAHYKKALNWLILNTTTDAFIPKSR